MGEIPWRAVGGFGAALLVAAVGRPRRSLSPSGAIAAVLVGGVIVAAAGWWWGLLVVVFFVTSSGLSLVRRRVRGADLVAARGDERDAVQVLANGGAATVLAAVAPWADRAVVFAAFAGAVAAVTADTWATELGPLSTATPRLISSGRPVPRGTSGGVTAAGTLASAGGGTLIGAIAAAGAAAGWAPGFVGWAWLLLVVGAAGLVGSLMDSLLGATIQAGYRCPVCGVPTERRVHDCGARAVRVRGVEGVDNDVVNAAASLAGATFAAIAAVLLP